MLIIPGMPAVQETTHSRELRRRVEEVVRDYQREHPGATEADVTIALTQSTPPQALSRQRAIGVAVAALLVGAFTVMASTGGGSRFEGSPLVWRIFGVAAVVAAVAIAVIRVSRRGQ